MNEKLSTVSLIKSLMQNTFPDSIISSRNLEALAHQISVQLYLKEEKFSQKL